MTQTEVLVIGAGPAGIAAATAAAENGRAVLVLDDNPAAGGQIWREATSALQSSSAEKGSAKLRAMERLSRSGARVLTGRSVFNADFKGGSPAAEAIDPDGVAERYECQQMILATGARERFLPFPGWTLPGVFGAGGLQAMVKGGLPIAGKRVVVAGTGPLLLAVAAHLTEYGATVVSVLEQAPLAQLARFALSLATHPARILQGLGYRATLRRSPYRTGCWVTEAIGDGQTLSAVRVTDGRRTWLEACDLLACGYHLVPNTEVGALLGCRFDGEFIQVDAAQRTSLPHVFCVGEPAGIAGLDAALTQGEIAGRTCAGKPILALERRAAREHAFGRGMAEAFALRAELKSLARPDTIVCRCEDVALNRLDGCRNWTDAKLQTRCGMGPCQGRVCGPAIQHLLGWKPVSVRQPLFPVPLQVFCSPSPGSIE